MGSEDKLPFPPFQYLTVAMFILIFILKANKFGTHFHCNFELKIPKFPLAFPPLDANSRIRSERSVPDTMLDDVQASGNNCILSLSP